MKLLEQKSHELFGRGVSTELNVIYVDIKWNSNENFEPDLRQYFVPITLMALSSLTPSPLDTLWEAKGIDQEGLKSLEFLSEERRN